MTRLHGEGARAARVFQLSCRRGQFSRGGYYPRSALFIIAGRLRENLFFDSSSARVLDPNVASYFSLIFQVFMYLTRFVTENGINPSV